MPRYADNYKTAHDGKDPEDDPEVIAAISQDADDHPIVGPGPDGRLFTILTKYGIMWIFYLGRCPRCICYCYCCLHH